MATEPMQKHRCSSEMDYPATSHGASKDHLMVQNHLEASFGFSSRGAFKIALTRHAGLAGMLKIKKPIQFNLVQSRKSFQGIPLNPGERERTDNAGSVELGKRLGF